MNKVRLDKELVMRGLASTRSQAENLIKLGEAMVNGKNVIKPGFGVFESDKISLKTSQRYVSRAGLKLASVTEKLRLDFRGKTVLDVGSSTGGFTDYALQHGSIKVVAVDVGTNQLHESLRTNPNIELHEQTDIRDFAKNYESRIVNHAINKPDNFDLILADLSFISLRDVLPRILKLVSAKTLLVAMVKPQFETGSAQKNKGVIKNEKVRRQIFSDFEIWASKYFVIEKKADSEVAGEKGNRERFYLLKKLQQHN